MVAYHVTPRRNLQRILAEGLRRDAAGWDAGYVWLSTSLAAARESATKQWGGSRDNAILEVNTEGLALVADPHPGFADWRQRFSVAVASNIDAHRIKEAA